VAVAVQADYYFGGAVDGAEVEVVVRQKPFYHGWHPIEPYPWYRDLQRPHWGRHYGPGQATSACLIAPGLNTVFPKKSFQHFGKINDASVRNRIK